MADIKWNVRGTADQTGVLANQLENHFNNVDNLG
jgi:hypothetical protein